MDDREREHPDEGTIHAWLDGALDDGASRALEAHVATCRACAERVAEARGLIAGASRIVGALDDAPSGAGPAWGQAPVAPSVAVTPPPAVAARRWRVTPARAAIAATVLVALGVSLTYERAAIDSEAPHAFQERAASAPVAATPAPPPNDSLLQSAIKRNIAATQPPRTVEAAPGPAVPTPPPTAPSAVADPSAPARVAVARKAIRAEDAAAPAAADRVVAGVPAGASTAADRALVATARADSATAQTSKAAAGGAMGSVVRPPLPVAQLAAAECYRIESANGEAATFGTEALPLIVRVDSARRASMFTVAGQATVSQLAVARAGDDSLLLRLRRIGYEGTLALGAPGDARAGVMRSRPLETQLSEVVVPEPRVSRRARPAAREPARKEVPPSQAPASAEANAALTAAPAVPIVARRTSCPG